MGSLIIAEKPSLGRAIAEAIGPMKKEDGYLEGNGYVVSWCFGHLYELYDLEQYFDKDYKKGDKVRWSMDRLPFYPESWAFRYAPREDAGVKKQIRILRELMNRKDIQVIYAAGDADREGEVIVRLVIDNNLRTKKELLRLWFPALTPEAIREGIREAKTEAEYERLYQAGRTRAAVDWLMGIELTRYATIKAGTFVRIGRCVCPIVGKVVEREKEIHAFVPEKYLAAVSRTEIDGVSLELTGKETFAPADRASAEEYAEALNKAGAEVVKVKKSCGAVKPGKLFSMSDLQSLLCRRDKSLTPSGVLDAVQSLYEKGYVTYPRTSSNYLCSGEIGRILATIHAFEQNGVTGLNGKDGDKSIYDDGRVESHSALTPTDRIPTGLSGVEKEVYEAIRNRFFAVFCEEECLADRTELTILLGAEEHIVKGSAVVQRGWMRFEESEKKDRLLPALSEGCRIPVSFAPVEKETSPPKRFTVESLNAWMKAPMRRAEKEGEYSDEEWKDILSEATICTEATRADTIDRCIRSGYIELKKGSYYAKEAGFYLVEVMEGLKIGLSAERTVELSRSLHDIVTGNMLPDAVLEETRMAMDRIFLAGADIRIPGRNHTDDKDREALGNCPKCGKPVYERDKLYGCADRACGFVLFKDNRYFTSMKKSLTKKMVKELLKEGKTYVPDLYSKKKDKTFGATVVMNAGGRYPSFSIVFDHK